MILSYVANADKIFLGIAYVLYNTAKMKTI